MSHYVSALNVSDLCGIAAHYNVNVTIHRPYHPDPTHPSELIFSLSRKLLCPPFGDRSLNIGLNCRQNSENCEVLRIPFQTFHSRCRCHAVWNPRLNCFSGALRVHLRYVSSYADAPFPSPSFSTSPPPDSIDQIHYEWLSLRDYPI